MTCGCIVKTVDHNIVDWNAKCQPHKDVWDHALESHDQFIEDMIFSAREHLDWGQEG